MVLLNILNQISSIRTGYVQMGLHITVIQSDSEDYITTTSIILVSKFSQFSPKFLHCAYCSSLFIQLVPRIHPHHTDKSLFSWSQFIFIQPSSSVFHTDLEQLVYRYCFLSSHNLVCFYQISPCSSLFQFVYPHLIKLSSIRLVSPITILLAISTACALQYNNLLMASKIMNGQAYL